MNFKVVSATEFTGASAPVFLLREHNQNLLFGSFYVAKSDRNTDYIILILSPVTECLIREMYQTRKNNDSISRFRLCRVV